MTVRVAQPQPDRMDQPVGFILKTYFITRASGATPEGRGRLGLFLLPTLIENNTFANDMAGLYEIQSPEQPHNEGAVSAPTSMLAIVALVLAFIPLLQPISLILAIVALVKINRSSGVIGGQGFAWVGIIVSFVAMVILLAVGLLGGSILWSYKAHKQMGEQMDAVLNFEDNATNQAVNSVGDGISNGSDTPLVTGPKDDSEGPIPIVGEGESIVINPAGSGGTRYLLVEIYVIRADEKDKGFKGAIDANSKKIQSLTMDKLSERDVQALSSPSVRKQIESDLKKQYQIILGSEHPIKELVVTRWILQ